MLISILLELRAPDLLLKDVDSEISIVTTMATSLAFGLGVLQVAISYLKSSIGGIENNGGQIIDLQAIARFILIMAALGIYRPFVQGVLAGGKQFESSVGSGNDAQNKALVEKYYSMSSVAENKLKGDIEDIKKSFNGDKAVIQKSYEIVKMAVESHDHISDFFKNFEYEIKKLTLNMFYSLTKICSSVIRIVMKTLTVMYGRVLLALGPITIACAMIPSMTGVFQKWLGSLLSVVFCLGTFALMDRFMYALFNDGLNALAKDNLSAEDLLYFIGQNLSIIFMFVSAFKITGMAFGSGDGGGIAGQTVQGVTTAVQTMAALGKSAMSKTSMSPKS